MHVTHLEFVRTYNMHINLCSVIMVCQLPVTVSEVIFPEPDCFTISTAGGCGLWTFL